MENRFIKTALMSRDGRYTSAPGRRALVHSAILLALATTPTAHAAVGDAVGSAFAVNTTGGTVAYPQVAMGAAGNFVVTWGTGSTMARCYAADGTALSDEVTVASSAGSGYMSEVAADATGNSVVLWQGTDYEVYAQRLDSSCALQGDVIDVGEAGSPSTAKHSYAVAMAADGRFVVVRYIADVGIFAQRYDADGNALGSAITVASGTHDVPVVASRADGGFVVSWNSSTVKLRYYDADGNPQTDRITYDPPYTENVRGVAMDGDGDVIAIWKNYYDYQIHAQRFDASGNQMGGNLDASDDAAADYSAGYFKEDQAVAMDDDGDFWVVWHNYYNADGIGAQRFDSADNKGGEVVVNAAGGIYPDVATDTDGDTVIVWSEGSNIKAQRYEGKSETVDLSVSGVADTATINVGNDITYTWTVTNNGSGSAQAISLDDVLPSGLAYSSFSDSLGDGWDCSDASGTVTCTLPRLISGGSSSVDLVLDTSALSGSSVDNSATGATPMSDTDSSNDSDTVTLAINNAPAFDVTPVVSGTAAVGNTLTVSTPGATDPEGDGYSVGYQWQSDGVDISGATSDSYTITSAEAHTSITVVLTLTDAAGAFATVTVSGGTVANTPASFDTTPTLSGSAEIGSTLSVADTATTDVDGDSVTLSYQWQADGVDIASATSSSYTLTDAEAHAAITVAVTADDGYDTTTVTSSSATVANRLPSFDATPSISGTALVGNTLSVTGTATTDADGDSVTLSYQWQAAGVDISGATAASYTLTSAEAHSTITVVVTANDGYGTSDITSSGVTVGNTAPVISGIDISGSVSPGQTVTAVVSGKDSDGDSLDYSYEWYVDSVLVGSSESFTLGSGDSGKTIFALVTVSDGNGGSDTSASMAQIIGNNVPLFDGTPSISGSAYVGSTLSVSGVSVSGADSLAYQWRRDGVAIDGATSANYTLIADDAHASINVAVTAVGSEGSSSVITGSVAVQNSSPTFNATASLSGTASVGGVITLSGLSVSDADGDAIDYLYLWYADGVVVGTDSSYTIQSDDAGKSLMAAVYANDGHGGLDVTVASGVTVESAATDSSSGSSSSSGGGGALGWLSLMAGLLLLRRRVRS